jgi:hypothetical protein
MPGAIPTSVVDSANTTQPIPNTTAATTTTTTAVSTTTTTAAPIVPETPRSTPFDPICYSASSNAEGVVATLTLKDGDAFQGYSFGYEQKSIAGELVFQTGMSPN